MRTTFLIIAVLVGTIAWGQSAEFVKIETKLQENITRGQWDEVQLLATELLVEEPGRGDGYYYAAFAFYKLGQNEQAGEYLEQAAKLADGALKTKIEQLKKDIAASTEKMQLLKSAGAQKKEGNSEKAAEDFIKVWEKDKTNVEPALNAVEIYIDRKEFTKALAILNDASLSKDPGAINLIRRLNETPQMKQINGYNYAMQQGAAQVKAGDFTTAITFFDKALAFKSGDPDALQAKRKAQDEVAWMDAKKVHTIEGYEAYINGTTLGQHKDEAIGYIRNGLVFHGEKYAKENDLAQMESFLFKYLNKYSGGPEDNKVATILCTTYLANAKTAATVKTASSQARAIAFYEATNKYCPQKYQLNEDIKAAKRKQTRYSRPDRGYLAYVYDSAAPIGISWGSINNKKVGVYITGNINQAIFTKSASYSVDNSGTITGSGYRDIRYKNVTKTGYGDFIFGFTKKITYPVWIYMGGGVTVKNVWWQMDTYSDNGTFDESEWVTNTDESKVGPLVDAGVIVDLKGLHMRGGVKTTDFNSVRFSVGLGFSWK